MLPDRARTLLDRLDAFLMDDAQGTFRRHAAARFLPGGGVPEPEDLTAFLDYAAFTHTDDDRRTCLGIFLEKHGAELPADVREAYERLAGSVFGVFKVESVTPGERLRLRSCGDGTTYEVVETTASRGLRAGMGLMGRLVPFRGFHELTGEVRALVPEAVYLTERLAAAHGEEGRAWLSDPIEQRALIRALERGSAPPVNRLEAEMAAEAVFSELNLPFRASELQARFRELDSPQPILAELTAHEFASMEDLNRAVVALNDLWNLTPRDELGGLTPNEASRELAAAGRPEIPRHLADDLAHFVSERFQPEDHPDDESRKRALAALEDEWLGAPQAELGGASPRQLMERPFPPPHRDVFLSPPDAPAWSPEALGELLQEPVSALWALHWMAQHPQHPWPRDLGQRFRALLDPWMAKLSALASQEPEEDEPVLETVLDLLDLVPHFRGHPLLEDLASAVAERMPELAALGGEVHASAVGALATLSDSKYTRFFTGALESGHAEAIHSAIIALGLSRHAQASGAILALFDDPDLPHGVQVTALAALMAQADEAAVETAAKKVLELAGRRDGVFIDLRYSLHGVRAVSCEVFDEAADELFPEEDDGVDASSLDFLMAASDPAAVRRAREALTPEAIERILRAHARGPSLEMAAILAERTLLAADLARAENPHFGALGASIAAFSRVMIERRGASVPRKRRKDFVVFQAGLLLKAIQGHDIAVEMPLAKGDRDLALALARVRDPWVAEVSNLNALASALDTESLLPVLESVEDELVRSNVLCLLAVLDPARLAWTLDELSLDDPEIDAVLHAVSRRNGDSFLESFVEHPPADRVEARLALHQLLAALGTVRARGVLESALEALLQGGSPSELLRSACSVNSPACAATVVDRLQSESETRVLLEEPEFVIFEELETAYCLFRLEGSVGQVLSALRRGREAELHRDEEIERYREDLRNRGGELPRAPTDEPKTIRRESPKVGRNDPCPCGSGQKHKHCCGRG